MNKMQLKKAYMGYQAKGGLPSNYQRVEYIESDGTQYIDSGIKGVAPIKAEIDYQFTYLELTGQSYVLIGGEINSNYCGLLGSNRYFQLYTQGNASAFSSISAGRDLNRHTAIGEITATSSITTCDGTSSTKSDISNTGANINMYVFAYNENGNASYITRAKMYSCKIYSNNTLVRNFIPCYDKTTYEVGLYDLVNGEFKTDENGGNFLMGRPIVCDKISGYQQVDYLQSTGNGEYVLTHTPLSYKTNITLDYEFVESGNYVIGANLSNDTNFMYVLGYGFVGRNTSWATSSFTDSLARRVVRSNANTWTKDGTTFATTTSMSATPTSTYKLCLFGFADNNNYTSGTTSKIKLYWAMKEDDNREILIPMRDTSSGQLGLYDLVSGAFLSSQGESFSLCGADIIKVDGYRQVEYIESSGTQYVDTKIKPYNLEITIDFQYVSRYGSTDNWLLGVYGGSNERYYAVNLDTSSHLIGFDTTGNTTFSYAYNPQSYNRHKLVFNEYNTHKIYLDGTQISGTAPTITSSANNIFLWSFSESNTSIRYPSVAKVYYCILKEDGVLVRNFIPMEYEDGTLGLYDTITKEFYTNQGSGTFTKGEYI